MLWIVQRIRSFVVICVIKFCANCHSALRYFVINESKVNGVLGVLSFSFCEPLHRMLRFC